MTVKTSCIIFKKQKFINTDKNNNKRKNLNKNSRYSELYTKLYNMFTIKRSFVTVNKILGTEGFTVTSFDCSRLDSLYYIN